MLLVLGFGSGPAPPSIPSNATVYLKIQAPWNEIEPSDVLTQFVVPPPTLRTVIETIKKAKSDARVKTLVIVPQAAGGLWAQLQDIRTALVDFRTSGKPLTAYLEYGGAQEYYLASAATRIVMMPAGTLDLSGLATYELFFRGALDKLGIYPDLLHIGDFKSASNTFTEKGFTAAHREMTKSLNRDWYDELVRAIADGRKRPEAAVRQAIDNGPYLPDGAMRAGLVDALGYDDQIDDGPPIQGTRRVEGDVYERAFVSSRRSSSAGRIALLYAVGAIASGPSANDGSVLGSDTFVKWIRKVRADSSIRAIVVRIDSPGGSAIASDVIWRELMLAREVKPLVVSMGDVAASGGYYIALPAHAIVAEPGTITGSIGVVTGKFVLKDTFEKLGIGVDSASDGRMAEIGSPFRPFSPAERGRVAEQMRATYDLFVKRVADGRQSTVAEIDRIAQGRVWTGSQAKSRGLVDEIGGLDRAIAIAKQRAKLDARVDVPLVVYPQKRGFFEVLANPFGASLEVGAAWLWRRPADRAVESLTRVLRLFRRGEPLTLMPNVFWK